MSFTSLRTLRGGPPPDILLALDPGQTTGWCIFEKDHLKAAGQADTGKEDPTSEVLRLFDLYRPTFVVCENYRVYAHKLKQHTNSDLHTPQLIGAIKLICVQRNLPLHLQMAHEVKGFMKDARLKEWGFFQRGKRHANDAIRHAAYFLIFKTRTAR